MIVLHRSMWLIVGIANTIWLAFRIIWPLIMTGVAEAVIVGQIFHGVQLMVLVISGLLFLGMFVLTISIVVQWTGHRFKTEWKKAWQWDIKTQS